MLNMADTVPGLSLVKRLSVNDALGRLAEKAGGRCRMTLRGTGAGAVSGWREVPEPLQVCLCVCLCVCVCVRACV